MKHKDKLTKGLSLLLAVVLLFAMNVSTVLAAATLSDTSTNAATLRIVNSDDSRKYNLYQVFYGDYANNALGNVEWGVSISTKDAESILSYLKAQYLPTEEGKTALANPFYKTSENESYFDSCTSASDVAAVLQSLMDNTKNNGLTETKIAEAFATIVNYVIQRSSTVFEDGKNYMTKKEASSQLSEGDSYTYAFTNIHQGYYLVTETSTKADGSDTSKVASKLILQVVGTKTINAKEDLEDSTPSSEKELMTYDGTTEARATTKDVAVGDTLYYKLTSTVVDMTQFSSFTQYFSDTMSKGLTFEKIEYVKVGDTTLTPQNESSTDTTNKYKSTVTTDTTSGETTLKLEILDMKQYQTAYETAAAGNPADIVEIEVLYSVTVNDKATVGSAGNDNTSKVYYSHNPSDPTDVTYTEDSTDTEKVYTTGIYIFKVGGENLGSESGLEGAEFALTGNNLHDVVVKKQTFSPYVKTDDSDTTQLYYKNNSNEYVMVSDQQTGLEAMVYKIYKLENDNYVQCLGEGEGTFYLKRVKDNEYIETSAADTNSQEFEKWQMTYRMTYDEETIKGNGSNTYTAEVGSNGKLAFDGIKAGTYTLTETKTPAGITRKIEPITITVALTQDGSENPKWTYSISGDDVVTTENTDGLVKQENDDSAGRLFIKVLNKTNEGYLPSTGSVGTTLFYILGSVLVVGAAILLIVKYRMKVRM